MNGNTHVSTSPSKKSYHVSNDVEDLISNLHESVLGNILSRLSLKEAMKTSILLKYWESKWTSICNVSIDDKIPRYGYQAEETFANFVDKVLLELNNITNFRLKSKTCCRPNQSATWISNILGRKVEGFEMRIPTPHAEQESIVLPFSLLSSSSTTLRKLELHVYCIFNNIDAKYNFPKFTSLVLYGVQFLNGNSDIDTFSLGFPVLETLVTTHCKWVNIKFLDIYAPALTTYSSDSSSNYYGVMNYSVKIFAPRLAKIKTRGHPENIIMNGGSQVVFAEMWADTDEEELFRDFRPHVRKLLDGFSNIEVLRLSDFMVKALLSGGLPLQRYDKLRQLILNCSTNTECLFQLLHASPILKYLYIDLCGWIYNYDYDGALESIPSCIVSHLEEIDTYGFRGKKRQIKLANFFLKNGGVLKKLSFKAGHSRAEQKRIITVLSNLPRKQTCLTIFFSPPDKTTVLS